MKHHTEVHDVDSDISRNNSGSHGSTRHALHILVMESLELQVELPMVLEMDNSGAVDIANSWSAGGRTRHVDVRNYFLHELKDQVLVVTYSPRT